jgi:hypothetical protein
LHIKQELANNRFVIAGAKPKQTICWQITGSRADAWARANPMIVEKDKPAREQGFYLHPEAHGQPKEKAADAELIARFTQAPPPVPPPPAAAPAP